MCNFYEPSWRAEYLRDDTYKHLVALVCTDIIATLPTILLNALVIFAVATRQRLRNNSTIFLASLAGADLFTGLVALPFAFLIGLNQLLGFGSFCSLEKAFMVILTIVINAPLSHLAVISVDRYIAIRYPLRYQVLVTKTRIMISIILAWAITFMVTINELVLALISESIHSSYSRVNIIVQTVTGSLFIVVILLSYGYIYSETRRQVKRLRAEQLPQEEIQRIKKERKAATTLAIILIALVITYLPATVVGTPAALPLGSISTPPRFRVIIWRWAESCIMLGSLFNPIIYCWRMEKLRRAFLEILHLRKPESTLQEAEIRGTQSNQPGPSTNQAYSLSENGQPVLLSFRQLQAGYLTCIEEVNE